MLGRVLALSAGAMAMAASCGPAYPTHDGYPETRQSPWEKPAVLELSSDREAEIDDTVNYAKRRRARWYAIDIPAFGEMDVRLSTSQLGKQDDEFDLAFEILAPDGRVLIRADAEEDDAGDEVKTRSLAEMSPGRYLIHVYAQRRIDQADFNLRVQYRASSEGPESSFPAEVAYVEPLAAVPAVDDAPPPPPRRCRGPRCRKRPPPPKEDEPAVKSFRALISLIRTSGSGTDIRIAAGGNRGIDKGWRGRVITRAGAAIPDGSFTVTRVTATEAYATVKASPDAVRAAKYVRLVPP